MAVVQDALHVDVRESLAGGCRPSVSKEIPSRARSASPSPMPVVAAGLLSLPPELFAHLILLILLQPNPSPDSSSHLYQLRSHPLLNALNLCSTSRRLWTSHPASLTRYLAALNRRAFPLPLRLPIVRGRNGPWDLQGERRILELSRWSDNPSRGKSRQKERVGRHFATQVATQSLGSQGHSRWTRLVGTKIYDVLPDGRRVGVWDIEDQVGPSAGRQQGSRNSGPSTGGGPQRIFQAATAGAIAAYDVDEDEGVVLIAMVTSKSTNNHDSEPSEGDCQTGGSARPHKFGAATTAAVDSETSTAAADDSDPLLATSVSLPEDYYSAEGFIFDIVTGAAKTRAPLTLTMHKRQLDSLSVEVCASLVLIKFGQEVQVRCWKTTNPSTNDSPYDSRGSDDAASTQDSPHFPAWPLVWSREPAAQTPELLSANLLGPLVFALSKPPVEAQGQDWGSTLSLYRPSTACSPSSPYQPLLAEIHLPIRSRPVRGLSYVQSGLGKRISSDSQAGKANALVVVCVEGFVWVGEMRSFLDLAFPTGGALSLYGQGWITLDSHWVRGNLHKCSLTSMDAHPLQPVALAGFRLAAIWSRRARTPSVSTNPGRIDPAPSWSTTTVFLRLLNAHPTEMARYQVRGDGSLSGQYDDARGDGEGEGEGAGTGEGRPQVHTMFTGTRFYAYCDHDISSYLDLDVFYNRGSIMADEAPIALVQHERQARTPSCVRVCMDGPRMLITAPAGQVLSWL